MTAQSAAVDRRANGYFVYSSSLTVSGFWVANGWLQALGSDADADSIGAAAVLALSRSENGVPDPGRNGKPFAPVLAAAGARNYATYLNGLRSVTLDSPDGTSLTVTPMHNAGPAEGLDELIEHQRNAAISSGAELGTLILAAFEFAT